MSSTSDTTNVASTAPSWQRCNVGIPLNDKWSEAVRTFDVLDGVTGEPLPGSPLSFRFGDQNTQDKWPALVQQKLKASGLDAYLRLGTATAVDGNIAAEGTIDFWHLDKPLRVFIGGFEETEKAATWSCALRDATGADATLAQAMEAFVLPPSGGVGQRKVLCTLRDKRSQHVIREWHCELTYTKDNLPARVETLATSFKDNLQLPHAVHDQGKALDSKIDKSTWTLKFPTALNLELILNDVTTGWVACRCGIPLNDKWSKAVRTFEVHDGVTGDPLPGSPLSLSFGDQDTQDKWPALIQEKLKASGLDAYLRLGTATAVDGNITAEGTVDFWRLDKPLRVFIGGFEETEKAATWSCALRDASGADATLAQAIEAFIQPPEGGVGERSVPCVLRDKRTQHVIRTWHCEFTYTAQDNLLARIEALANSIESNIQVRHVIHDYGKALNSKSDKEAWALQLPTALGLEITLGDAPPLWFPCHSGIPLNDKWGKAVRTFIVHDGTTGQPLAGSPLSFSFGDQNTKDKWPALVQAKLKASGLDANLRLGTETAVDGDITEEGTVDFWRLDEPLRIFIGGFEETDKAAVWSSALSLPDGGAATFAQVMKAFVQPPEGGVGNRRVEFIVRDKRSHQQVHRWLDDLEFTVEDNPSARIDALVNSINSNMPFPHQIHSSGRKDRSEDRETWTLSLAAVLQLELTVSSIYVSDGVTDFWAAGVGSDLDNDLLPEMIGFETDHIGGSGHVWRSPGYLLADRDLAVGEQLKAWVISEQDGQVVKSVGWEADASTCKQSNWPAAFLKAINAAPDVADGGKVLCAGFLQDAGGLGVADAGSPTSEAFRELGATAKASLNRLWCYGEDCRLFSNAPFKANQVIAARVPEMPVPQGETIAIQVRDRTTQYLYETHLFTPLPSHSTDWAKKLCESVNAAHAENGLLRAGVRHSDGITVKPADTKNALWIPQFSSLSVEVDSLTWRKHRSVSASSAKAGDVIQLIVHDTFSGVNLPGSPFDYTVKKGETGANQWLAALAEALKEAPIGKYVRAANATSPDQAPTSNDCVFWALTLPVKIFIVGMPGLIEQNERALATAEGRLLTFADLYKDYKSGLRVTLTEKLGGRVLETCEWTPVSTDIPEADWYSSLTNALSVLCVSTPFLTWGAKAESAVPAASGDCTLWLPKHADYACIVQPPSTGYPPPVKAPPALQAEMVFLKDKLTCEEAVIYTATIYNHHSYKTDPTQIATLVSWGGDVLSQSDKQALETHMIDPTHFIPDPFGRRAGIIDDVKTDKLNHDFYRGVAHGLAQKRMGSANLSALLASRMARPDVLSTPANVWQLDLPADHWLDCLSMTEARAEFAVRTQHSSDLLRVVKSILKQREAKKYSSAIDDPSMAAGLQALKEASLLQETADEIRKVTDEDAPREAQQWFNNIDGYRPDRWHIDNIYDFVRTRLGKRGLPEFLALRIATQAQEEVKKRHANGEDDNTIARPYMEAALLHIDAYKLEQLRALLADPAIAHAVRQEDLDQLGKHLREYPFTYACTLQLQLTTEAYKQGIRFVSYASDFSPRTVALSPTLTLGKKGRRTGGIGLHVPPTLKLPSAFNVCSASYVSKASIDQACDSSLHIHPPFTGAPFSPKDTLCADYAATLGSEVYDVSGATENGVDPKTGLFHAHYPVGVIRGLEGKGPEVDLTLHYSATRANEGALGDGWALRFSSYDNRMHRLTLSNGQTVTLTAENVDAAMGEKRLAINGITLTGAKGGFDSLTELTVVFPTGRSETLAKPDPHDDQEPSEHYKTALVEKLEHIKANLDQWLKESGITTEQTNDYKAKIEGIEKMQKDMKRKALILVPSSIKSPLGGILTLNWAGKNGHVRLNSIADGKTTLLSATHEEPVAVGTYSSTFTVWPDSDEAYDVTLAIEDCLLTHLSRKGKNEASPVQSVMFGYEGDAVLDRVLCSVAEEDGSLEVVGYVPQWHAWELDDGAIPLPRVGRHTLVPGAGQQAISHTWQWFGRLDQLHKEGDTYAAICMVDNGGSWHGPFTRRSWTLRNGLVVESQVVKEVPEVARETTTMVYPDSISNAVPAVRYRLATQPVSTTVVTEDLRPERVGDTHAEDTSSSSAQESQS